MLIISAPLDFCPLGRLCMSEDIVAPQSFFGCQYPGCQQMRCAAWSSFYHVVTPRAWIKTAHLSPQLVRKNKALEILFCMLDSVNIARFETGHHAVLPIGANGSSLLASLSI